MEIRLAMNQSTVLICFSTAAARRGTRAATIRSISRRFLSTTLAHQHRDRDVRAAFEPLDALSALAVAALESRERPVVLLDVLGHQHDVALRVLDEVSVAPAQQLGHLILEALAANATVQWNQESARQSVRHVSCAPDHAMREPTYSAGRRLRILGQHFGGEALEKGLLHHGYLAPT
jgi:hypothetical protein